MAHTLTTATAKQNLWQKHRLFFHALIMLAIMGGIGCLTPFGSLTPLGLKLLGIFIAMLYGWTTCGLFWPSLIGIIALPFTGLYDSLGQFLSISFGNETLVFLLFVFAFTAVIDDVGLIEYIANLLISFKFLNNRPWLFSFVFLIAAYICGGFINMFAAVIVFWGILYIVVKRFGFECYDKYPTLMIIGVVLASSIGGCIMPYKPVPLIVLRAYSQVSGTPVDFLQYITFSLPATFMIMVFYLLICRFVFRPDLKALRQLNVDFVDKNALILSPKQKTAMAFLIAFIFMMIAPSLLPANFFLTVFIKKLGIAGCVILLVILMCLLHFDGKPMMDFRKMAAQGINWDMYVTMCFVIPFAGIFTSDPTGIKPFIVELVRPVLSGLSPTIFIILTMLLATVITNFANNMVVAAVFATMIFTLGTGLGLSIMPLIAVLILCANLAVMTPAASPLAAMMFANTEWCRAKDLYKYCTLTVVIAFILTMAFGMFWANIIY